MGQKNSDKLIQHLLMTVIGTTISIILTFGTSSIVDRVKKKAEGRQMAMTVIHDIDNTATAFRDMSKEEEDGFKQSQYILNHLDEIDSIGNDTLMVALLFVLNTSGDTRSFDDSSEQIFLSSQDTWKNIDNTTFIDAVTEFYQSRRSTFESIADGLIWEKPVDEDVYYKYQMTCPQYVIDLAGFLAGQLRKDNVRYYIECSPARQRSYNQLADSFEMTSKRCKFLMGITDKEMQDYIENRNHPGRQLKDKNLIGEWTLIDNSDLFQGYEFRPDHTVKSTLIQYYIDPFFVGRLELKAIYHGTWEIQGDSLITVVDQKFDYSVDSSGVSYLPGKRYYVDNLVKKWEADVQEQLADSTNTVGNRQAYRVALDPSGNRIEMVTEEGGTETQYYISRNQ